MVQTRGRKAEQAEETRALLVATARERFGEVGYAAASIDDIALRVGVTIGAVYHHFQNKRALFQAVYEQIEGELTERIVSGSRVGLEPGWDAMDEVRAGSHAFLDACLDHAVQRIILLEAPSVLGWDVRKDLTKYGLALIRNGLRRSIENGLIEPQPVEPMAHILRAALTEAAVLLARSPDQASARADIGESIDRLVNGLRR